MPGLNDKQLEACCTTDGPLLILAGAGSGKTRVITHRIAYLIDEMSVNPYNILAITFTNKAAAEMRERVDNLVGFGAESVWVSTFHSMCVRILRKHIDKIGGTSSFTIYDASEQKTVVKEVLKYLQLDPKLYPERAMLSAISRCAGRWRCRWFPHTGPPGQAWSRWRCPAPTGCPLRAPRLGGSAAGCT